ncbi:acetylornithine deacetylase [Rhodovulum adriaticum]|uniref:Acetylornithine deacetylase n=1 Tax=Rhodovulum adriaticum TaxID=35804 RepID=A0A4R2NXW3_RHOAD|nr:acetylornithine deacetylase [Rhodovulum adriaticum]MBK1636264.1 acetylornithine deacetylase [Rhodovulum adriaticum]TCP26265.1 acetylornithine deacetylase [Rhodovulum adriaticum]
MATPLSPRELLEKLVSFPTVSCDSNLALVDWVQDYLTGHGIPVTRVWNAARDKASLYAHAGPQAQGGVLLSGHTDVVPVEGQDWDTDPWAVVERNGRLYGRGTCDMKGFNALAIWALVRAQAQGVKHPLQLALSHDEEVGCLGAPPMIDNMQASGFPKAHAVIVGEPSRMQVVTGHKGTIGFDVRVTGFEVHSSLMHTGVSAVMEAAALIDWANDRNAENRARPPQGDDALFDPPWTTLHVGQIAGGTAHNITAAHCAFGLDMRCLPGEGTERWRAAWEDERARVEARMQAIRPEARVESTPHFDVPPLRPEADNPAEALARRLTGDNAPHVVSYATEAGQFQQAGYSTVICGPGDISQAHQPNEYIALDQFRQGQAFMDRLLTHLQE